MTVRVALRSNTCGRDRRDYSRGFRGGRWIKPDRHSTEPPTLGIRRDATSAGLHGLHWIIHCHQLRPGRGRLGPRRHGRRNCFAVEKAVFEYTGEQDDLNDPNAELRHMGNDFCPPSLRPVGRES